MSNERETKEVKIGSHILIVKTYITGREARDIESAFMDKLDLSQSQEKGTEIKSFKAGQLKEKQDMQVKSVVVSFDGQKENVLDLILDLPVAESEEVMNVIRDIAEPKKEEAGK